MAGPKAKARVARPQQRQSEEASPSFALPLDPDVDHALMLRDGMNKIASDALQAADQAEAGGDRQRANFERQIAALAQGDYALYRQLKDQE
jgi:hypothetical protein